MNPKIISILASLTALSALVLPAGSNASESAVDLSIAKGDSNLETTNQSYALRIGYKRLFDAWHDGTHITLSPYAGAAGFVWKPSHHSEVWGATALVGVELGYKGNWQVNPYLSASIGPTIISNRHLAERNLGSEILFESQIALGMHFGSKKHHSLEAFFAHYSNTSLWANTNPGYEIYGITYRHSF